MLITWIIITCTSVIGLTLIILGMKIIQRGESEKSRKVGDRCVIAGLWLCVLPISMLINIVTKRFSLESFYILFFLSIVGGWVIILLTWNKVKEMPDYQFSFERLKQKEYIPFFFICSVLCVAVGSFSLFALTSLVYIRLLLPVQTDRLLNLVLLLLSIVSGGGFFVFARFFKKIHSK